MSILIWSEQDFDPSQQYRGPVVLRQMEILKERKRSTAWEWGDSINHAWPLTPKDKTEKVVDAGKKLISHRSHGEKEEPAPSFLYSRRNSEFM